MKLILKNLATETDHIRVMTFQNASGGALPEYSAGAHIEFDLGAAGKRAYSLVDWPTASDDYTVAVQLEESGEGGSKAMHAMSEGHTVEVAVPKNDFALLDSPAPVLLLAGGIGITPMISMASQLQQQAHPFQIHYTARDASRMGFADELTQAFGDALTLHLDDDDLSALDLPKLMHSQAADTQVYLCGPRAMIDAARSAAIEAGLAENAIHIELFSTPEPEAGDTAFEVEISESGQVITVTANQTIIEALEAAGVDVMYDCQRGDCGICQCTVVSGTPDHRDVVLSDDEKAAGNVMQICVSRAKSSRLVIDI